MSKEKTVVATGMLLILLTSVQAGEIYKWTDAQGKVHFTDRPPSSRSAEKLELRINTYTGTSVSEHFLSENREVVIYTTEWCGVCRKAKNYFRNNKIPYKEYDIEKTARGKRDFQRLKAHGVPVILVGRQRLNGFTPTAFDRLYKAK